MSNVRDVSMCEAKGLSLRAKEYTLKASHKIYEQKEARVGKTVVDWIHPANHVPINYFF